jgi:FixJ family two-component response regulator
VQHFRGFAVDAISNPFDVRLAFVLDDEARLGVALCKVLASMGIESRQFVDADAFLDQLEPCNPDLVFLDLALGQSDAIEVIHQLEARRFKGRVMLISGRDMSTLLEVERIGKSHGLTMLPSLPKPFRVADIKECLQLSPALQPGHPEGEDVVVGAEMPLRLKA